MNRGIENRNPLNIRKSKDVFNGEKVPSRDRSFKEFVSFAYGYRAAFVILGSYNDVKKNTIEKIVKSWAPPSENNTENYIRHIEEWSGIKRDFVLKKTGNRKEYIAIVKAMSRQEIGVCYDEEVEKGFNLQTKLK